MQIPRKVAAAVELYRLTELGHNYVSIAKASNLSRATVQSAMRVLRNAGVVTIRHGGDGGVRRAWNAPKDKKSLPSLLGYPNTLYFWNAVRLFKIKTFPKMLKIKIEKPLDGRIVKQITQLRLAQCGHPSTTRWFKCEKCMLVMKPESEYDSYSAY